MAKGKAKLQGSHHRFALEASSVHPHYCVLHAVQLRAQAFTTTHPTASTSAQAHAPHTSTNLCNAESIKQLTPHLLFKNILLQKEKNTMQYKRLTASSSLLHNFQPIRKTNKSPTTGGRGLGLFEGWVFFPFAIRK